MLLDDLLAEHFEAGPHQVGGGLGIKVVDRQFMKLSAEEAPLNSAGLGFRQEALLRLDSHHPDCGLISRHKNCNIQRMSGCPNNQLVRSIAPAQAEGWFKHALRDRSICEQQPKDRDSQNALVEALPHTVRFHGFGRIRKVRSLRRGTLLVEAGIALSILTVVGLILLKLSLNILHPRQIVLHQVLTDAHMTYERSLAERVPFEDLVKSGSKWPAYPAIQAEQMELGRLPGGRAIMGTVTRTRKPDPTNFPIDGGTGSPESTNPAAMKVWRVQSVVTYTVGGHNYAKSRTVIRSQ